MNKTLCTLLALVVIQSATPSIAADAIPKAGRVTTHSGYRGMGEVLQLAEGRTYWGGVFYGVLYNDSGSGLFQEGTSQCVGSVDTKGETSSSKGFCTFTDSDGSQIFGDWGATSPAGQITGSGKFVGGSGKLSGVTGRWDYQCHVVSLKFGQWTCKQQFDYRLPQ